MQETEINRLLAMAAPVVLAEHAAGSGSKRSFTLEQ